MVKLKSSITFLLQRQLVIVSNWGHYLIAHFFFSWICSRLNPQGSILHWISVTAIPQNGQRTSHLPSRFILHYAPTSRPHRIKDNKDEGMLGNSSYRFISGAIMPRPIRIEYEKTANEAIDLIPSFFPTNSADSYTQCNVSRNSTRPQYDLGLLLISLALPINRSLQRHARRW